MANTRIYDLEDRLIKFAVEIIEISRKLPRTRDGIYFSGQIIRSGSSGALNYGEAQGAESRKDFIHKSKIILEELRETQVSLKIIEKATLYTDYSVLKRAMKENIAENEVHLCARRNTVFHLLCQTLG